MNFVNSHPITMGPKKASARGSDKKKKMITMETKLEIIAKYESGMRTTIRKFQDIKSPPELINFISRGITT